MVVKGAGHGIRQYEADDVRNRIIGFFHRHIGRQTANAPVKHLFVAKLLLRRMETVDMTPEQVEAFNKLSRDLRNRIEKMRADVGITKTIIKRRDEAYKELKETDLQGEAFWKALQERAEITTQQREVFRETQEHYASFRAAALALLTDAQRARLPKGLVRGF